MDSFLQDTAKVAFASAQHDWASNTYKIMLVTASYAPNPDNQYVSSATAAEINADASGTAYVAGYGGSGRKALAGKSVTVLSSTGTASAGGASTITLAAGASSSDGAYVGAAIRLTGGLGSGEVGRIIAYVGSTRVATVASAWGTAPDATSTYKLTRVSLDATDTTWTAISAGTPKYALIVQETGGSDATALILGMLTLPTPLAPTNGGDYVLQWPADGLVVT